LKTGVKQNGHAWKVFEDNDTGGMATTKNLQTTHGNFQGNQGTQQGVQEEKVT
jgi:hypothetical protein